MKYRLLSPSNKLFYTGFILLLVSLGAANAAIVDTPDNPPQIILKQLHEREIAHQETHNYLLNLEKKQYVCLTLRTFGINLRIRIYDPNGHLTKDYICQSQETTQMSMIVITQGGYKVVVRADEKSAFAGKYELKLKELRWTQTRDKLRLAAEEAFAEGEKYRNLPTTQSLLSAIGKFKEASSLWLRLGDKQAEAYSVKAIADSYYQLKNVEKALSTYTRVLAMNQKINNPNLESEALSGIGYCHLFLGDKTKALEFLEHALSLSRANVVKRIEAQTLRYLGEFYFAYGEYTKSLELHLQALSLNQQMLDRKEEAYNLYNIAANYALLPDAKSAFDYYQQALNLWRTLQDIKGEALTLVNLAHLNSVLGKKQEAIQLYDKALSIFKIVSDLEWEASSYNGLGFIYEETGDKKRALEYRKKALKIFQRLGLREAITSTLISLGEIHQALGEHRQALAFFHQAQRYEEAINNESIKPRILTNIGLALAALGYPEKALLNYQKALALELKVWTRRDEAYILKNIANLYLSKGEQQIALEYFKQVLSLNKAIGDQFGETEALYKISFIEQRKAHVDEAKKHVEEAIQLAESLRNELKSPEHRRFYFATVQKIHDLYIDILMQQHKRQPTAGFDLAALEVSEKARARTLVESLLESGADILESVDATLLAREQEVLQKITNLAANKDRLLARPNTESQVAAIQDEIKELTTQLEIARSLIRAANPRYGALTASQSLTVKEIQSLLDTDTWLLAYRLGDERSYLWVVSSTAITSFELPARKKIEDEVLNFYRTLTESRNSLRGQGKPAQQTPRRLTETDYRNSAARLSQYLLSPIVSQLHAERLVIIADGALQYINFAALSAPDSATDYHPLMLDHEIVKLPSAAVLAVLRRQFGNRPPGGKSVAIIADPVFDINDERLKLTNRTANNATHPQPLDSQMQRTFNEILARNNKRGLDRLLFSYREAEAIRQAAKDSPVMQALGFEANREKILRTDFTSYRFVHFATHGLLNNDHPDLSGIVLSLFDERGNQQNGYLRLADICGLKLNAELVVLSACQTALGKEFRGEGLMGLTRGFMQAGAQRVVASLWNVDDKATAELMKRFYEKLLVDNQRPAAALRSAQIEMFNTKRWQSPYYWAGFALQGEWQ